MLHLEEVFLLPDGLDVEDPGTVRLTEAADQVSPSDEYLPLKEYGQEAIQVRVMLALIVHQSFQNHLHLLRFQLACHLLQLVFFPKNRNGVKAHLLLLIKKLLVVAGLNDRKLNHALDQQDEGWELAAEPSIVIIIDVVVIIYFLAHGHPIDKELVFLIFVRPEAIFADPRHKAVLQD